MNRKVLVAIIMLLLVLPLSAQKKQQKVVYHDAAVYDLVGPVRSFRQTTSDPEKMRGYPISSGYYSPEGQELYVVWGNVGDLNQARRLDFERDANGYVTKYDIAQYGGDRPVAYFTYDRDGRILTQTSERGDKITCHRKPGKGPDLIEYSDGRRYSCYDYAYDSHGNWYQRFCKDLNTGKVECQQRMIEYWDEPEDWIADPNDYDNYMYLQEMRAKAEYQVWLQKQSGKK